MSRFEASPEAWVAAAVGALNRHGSWTGRIHAQKLLAVAQLLRLADPPFRFSLYQYGPYSREADGVFAQMELYGYLIRTYPAEGYGPSYRLTPLGQGVAATLDRDDATAVEHIATSFADADSQSLELRATALWVERMEHISDRARIADRVLQLKPKYSRERVAEEAECARLMASKLERPIA